MLNPFRLPPTKKEDIDNKKTFVSGVPLSITLTLTEVKNANALLKFTSDSFESSNDDLTAAILTAVGLKNDDDDANAEEETGIEDNEESELSGSDG